MKKSDNRARCDQIIWDGSRCKRPAEWLTERNELWCSFHGCMCNSDFISNSNGKMKPKAIPVINTKAEPYIRG